MISRIIGLGFVPSVFEGRIFHPYPRDVLPLERTMMMITAGAITLYVGFSLKSEI